MHSTPFTQESPFLSMIRPLRMYVCMCHTPVTSEKAPFSVCKVCTHVCRCHVFILQRHTKYICTRKTQRQTHEYAGKKLIQVHRLFPLFTTLNAHCRTPFLRLVTPLQLVEEEIDLFLHPQDFARLRLAHLLVTHAPPFVARPLLRLLLSFYLL